MPILECRGGRFQRFRFKGFKNKPFSISSIEDGFRLGRNLASLFLMLGKSEVFKADHAFLQTTVAYSMMFSAPERSKIMRHDRGKDVTGSPWIPCAETLNFGKVFPPGGGYLFLSRRGEETAYRDAIEEILSEFPFFTSF